MAGRLSIAIALFVIFVAVVYRPVSQYLIHVGIGITIVNVHGAEDLVHIPGTEACEDLHQEQTTGYLFTACQKDLGSRLRWFPPFLIFNEPHADIEGFIASIDPKTFAVTRLKLKGFTGNFITHGIDILNDPQDPESLWIYAVNHLSNPERYDVYPAISDAPERPHIEIFRHKLGSDEADYVRSVRHPLIRMPNDILIESPSSFYVTDDHVYYQGILRSWEDAGTQHTAPASKTIYVSVTDMKTNDPAGGIEANVALDSIHNNNGIGRGSPYHTQEVAIIDAAGGVLVRARRPLNISSSPRLESIERISLDSTLDNPSYFWDPYATPGNNASGFILPGLRKAVNAFSDFSHAESAIPSVVWHVRSNDSISFERQNTWEKRLIFQDDGKQLRTASGAVMVAIDPAENEGKKQGWLFVTGFGSKSMIAAKINL